MKNSSVQETLLSLALIILLIFFINPFNFWMPDSMEMLMLFAMLFVFAVFTSFVWKENPKDEREALHRMLAGRYAFLAGSIVLVIGMTIEVFKHSLDVWLPLALGAMILAKIVASIYGKTKN